MPYSAAIQFLYDLRWFGAKFGLSNTLKLAALAGNPQNQLRFIHIAGTNGKGSTAAMLESIYRTAGLKVGLFTSPHLVAFGERIQVNRRLIPESEIVRLVDEMRELLEEGWGIAPPVTHSSATASPAAYGDSPPEPAEHPTFFEVVTVMALRYFAEQKCELVVWETGLGGRLDATNIVTPLASVITNIQFDHQKYLGETLTSIAREKAGIIKAGVPVVTGAESPEALEIIRETASQLQAPFTLVAAREAHAPPLDTLKMPLLGEHQKMNAAVSLAVARALVGRIPVSERQMAAGLARVRWPGRMQVVRRGPGQILVLDGAHNVGGAETLAAALRQHFPGARPALVLGILRDKDWAQMCEILAPLASRILLAPVQNERSAEPHGLAEICHQASPGVEVRECSCLAEALQETGEDRFVTIAGSLYLIGEAMELLGLSSSLAAGERGLNEWTATR